MPSSDRPLLRSPWGTFKYLLLSPTFITCVAVVGLALGAGVFSSLAVDILKKKEIPPVPVKPAPVPTRTIIQRPVAPAPAPAPANRRASTTLTGSCNGTLTIYASGPNASISLEGRRGRSNLSLSWEEPFAATLAADGSVSGSWNCGN